MTYKSTPLWKYARYCKAWVLSAIPGRIGRKYEEPYYWARREVKMGACQEQFNACLNTLDQSSICVDFGANVGEVTAKLAASAGHVYAFEPDPWAFDQLQKRFASVEHVTLFNKAIGATDDMIVMRRDPDFSATEGHRSQTTSKFNSLLWRNAEVPTFVVEQIDVCTFLREVGRPIALMKVDIEGGEIELLERLLDSPERELVERMFVETHEGQMAEIRERCRCLRKKVKRMSRPVVNMDWH